jgi:hypothetical protein
MIHGAHAIIYSKQPEIDRAFLRDVIGCRMSTPGMGGS